MVYGFVLIVIFSCMHIVIPTGQVGPRLDVNYQDILLQLVHIGFLGKPRSRPQSLVHRQRPNIALWHLHVQKSNGCAIFLLALVFSIINQFVSFVIIKPLSKWRRILSSMNELKILRSIAILCENFSVLDLACFYNYATG